MNELSSPPTDFEITPEDWQQTPPSVQALLLRLHTQVGALTQEVAQLREQLNRHSGNSSQPPSSDPPAQKAPQNPAASAKKGRKRGGQPGHKGHHRLLVSPDQVDQVVICKPSHCGDCGRALAGDDSDPYRYQTVEIPVAQRDVTEYQVHRLPCPDCGAETRGHLPAEAAASPFGVNLSTWLVLLMGVYRLSKRQVVDLLAVTYGVHLSPGTVVNIQNRASQALAPLVEAAYEAVKTQPARYIDDTSWQQGDIERKSYL